MRTRESIYWLKCYDFWFLGKKYIGCNLSLRQFSWGPVFLETICPRRNYVDDKSSERQVSSGAISRKILSGGSYLWSNCPGATSQGQSSWGQLSGGQYSSRAIVQGVIIWGQSSGSRCPGVIVWGGNFPRGHCPDTIFYVEKVILNKAFYYKG